MILNKQIGAYEALMGAPKQPLKPLFTNMNFEVSKWLGQIRAAKRDKNAPVSMSMAEREERVASRAWGEDAKLDEQPRFADIYRWLGDKKCVAADAEGLAKLVTEGGGSTDANAIFTQDPEALELVLARGVVHKYRNPPPEKDDPKRSAPWDMKWFRGSDKNISLWQRAWDFAMNRAFRAQDGFSDWPETLMAGGRVQSAIHRAGSAALGWITGNAGGVAMNDAGMEISELDKLFAIKNVAMGASDYLRRFGIGVAATMGLPGRNIGFLSILAHLRFGSPSNHNIAKVLDIVVAYLDSKRNDLSIRISQLEKEAEDGGVDDSKDDASKDARGRDGGDDECKTHQVDSWAQLHCAANSPGVRDTAVILEILRARFAFRSVDDMTRAAPIQFTPDVTAMMLYALGIPAIVCPVHVAGKDADMFKTAELRVAHLHKLLSGKHLQEFYVLPTNEVVWMYVKRDVPRRPPQVFMDFMKAGHDKEDNDTPVFNYRTGAWEQEEGEEEEE
jgi:hypothetical protein